MINSSPYSARSFSGFKQLSMRRGAIFGMILVCSLLAFEAFNYSTTDFALTDLLGSNLTFLGLRWATILSIAFCGIDFAGIARLFTPEQGRDEPAEVWYLFAAWLLAATMNACLTWWGVAVAVQNHQTLGSSVIGTETLFKVVPVFVAVMVWLIRVLIIGSFSMAGERLFSLGEGKPAMLRSALTAPRPSPVVPQPRPLRPSSLPLGVTPRPEPSYHPVGGMAARSNSSPAFRNGESQATRT
jgi:hypothetical protein